MCTLVLLPPAAEQASQTVTWWHNRDEARSRPAALLPAEHPSSTGSWFGPTDPQGGGSWRGYNRHGVVIFLLNANPHSFVSAPPQAQSRGLLVPAVMACRDLTEVQAA